MPADLLQGTPLPVHMPNDNQTAAVKSETVKMFFQTTNLIVEQLPWNFVKTRTETGQKFANGFHALQG